MNCNEIDPELGLHNPYSKATCFILYLYSMEFGDPPLYAELNRVARDMDPSHVKNLGPIQRAISVITEGSEKARCVDDKIKTGYEIKEEMGGVTENISGAFMLFRGAQMKDEWLQPWVQKVGEVVHIPGNVSCSRNL